MNKKGLKIKVKLLLLPKLVGWLVDLFEKGPK